MSIDDLLTHHWHIVAYVTVTQWYNSYNDIVATQLHKLFMYMISYTMNCVCYNSFNLFDNTHTIEICRVVSGWSNSKTLVVRLVAKHPI